MQPFAALVLFPSYFSHVAEIQEKLRTYNAAGVKLTLHIAIAVGKLSALHIGGTDGRWEFFMAGYGSRDAFVQIRSALEKSKSGEICVSPEMWKLVSDIAEGKEIVGDWQLLKVQPPHALEPHPPLDLGKKNAKNEGKF